MNRATHARRLPAAMVARALVAALLAIAALPAIAGRSAAQAPDPCAAPVANPVVCENSKPGSPSSEWGLDNSTGDLSIQGFTTDISADQGGTVTFKVKTDAAAYRLDIYRMGYYAGNGARKVATVTPSAALPQTQPECLSDAGTGLVDCGNWAVSGTWPVPASATSGIYFAKLVRPDTGGSSHVVFVVRDDDGGSDVLFQTSDSTWQAYNRYGGNSLYFGEPVGRAYKVSYNRPMTTRGCCAEDWVFNAEYPMVRWMEQNGYDVSYSTDIDSDRRGAEILEHEAFLSVGHDEYWSAGQRANVEAARAAGVHLAFLGGNDVYWKTRWEPAIDGSGTSHRTLVCYKESKAPANIDPDPAWTGTWRDARFSPPSDGGRPENALIGQIFTSILSPYEPSLAIKVPASFGRMRLWRNTSVASLAPGETATLAAGTLGYEFNEDLDNGFRPPGVAQLSQTVEPVPQRVNDDTGVNYAAGTATHSLTLYRHASGALVFSAGTVQWAWGLDSNHDRAAQGSRTPDPRMQQAMINLFADMGIQPGTLAPGMVRATASTDTAAPTSTITSPASGTQVVSGTPVTVTGTAAEAGGGVVAGVEISVDGGQTWRRADGRESWTFTFTPAQIGPLTIKTRAVDDSANLETPGAGVTMTVRIRDCPCSIWGAGATPVTAASTDTRATEVGVKFRSDVAGFITGVRFYKGAGNTGTHIGNLWNATGTRLATATFTAETASGWQQVDFPQPVAVTAGTTYVASYFAPVGRYAADARTFSTAAVTNPPLTALANGTDGTNGVYRYGTTSTFPRYSYNATNYWVDVVFRPAS